MATTASPIALVFSNVNVQVGDNNVQNGVANKKIYVTQYYVSTEVPFVLQSADKTTVVASFPDAQTRGSTSNVILPTGVGLIATCTNAGKISGYIMGFVA